MTILVIAPHADDEVIGMGGSIARFVKRGSRVVTVIVTGHGDKPHPLWTRDTWETVRDECRRAAGILGVEEVLFRELPAACLDHVPAHQINSVLADLIQAIKPSEIYIPFAFDLHKDHGAVAYGVSVVTRPYLEGVKCVKRVLAYETLSETHLAPQYLAPAFQPNVFMDISATLEQKLSAMRAYASQLQPDHLPRSIAALRSLACLRGTHIGVQAAEAFLLLGEYDR